MRELSSPDELFGVWFSFLAPAGIPEGARKALVEAIERAVKSPAVATRLALLGIVQSYAAPEALVAEIARGIPARQRDGEEDRPLR